MTKTFTITARIQQLRERMPNETVPERQIDLLNELAACLSERNRAESSQLAVQAKQASTDLSFVSQPYEVGIAHSNITLAHLAFRQADYETAIRLAHDAQFRLDAAGTTTRMAATYLVIANCYSELGNSVEASRYGYMGVEVAQSSNDQHALANLYLDLALDEEAQAPLEEALALAKKIGNEEIEALALSNLAAYFLRQNKTEGVERLLEDAIAITKQIGWIPLRAHVLSKWASLYRLKDDMVSAESFYEQSLQDGRICGDPLLLGLILHAYATFEQARGNSAKAIEYINEGVELAERSQQTPMLARCYQTLTTIFEESGDLAEALAYYKKYAELSKSTEQTQRTAQQKLIQISQQSEADRREARYEREKNIELEKRVAERTIALEASLAREHALAAEIEAALAAESEISALKSKIITNISHEFRTPLTVINNSAELLDKYFDKLSPDKRQQHLARVRESIVRLSAMLGDLTLLNEKEGREIRPNYTHLPFCEAAEQLRHHQNCQLLDLSHIEYQFDATNTQLVAVDITLLSRILNNLLTNSVKFSAENAPITVSVAADENQLVLTVQDNGIGIASEDQAKVFELFYRGQNAGNRRGIGLGLNIVERITKVLNSKIVVESAGENSGTRIQITVPCTIVESPEPAVAMSS